MLYNKNIYTPARHYIDIYIKFRSLTTAIRDDFRMSDTLNSLDKTLYFIRYIIEKFL